MTIQKPELKEGERYIGATVNADGELTHIILLPGSTKATWKKAMNWAEKLGGDLPSRVEQSMLFAGCREEFEGFSYWSNQTDSDESGWAWFQYFSNGRQDRTLKYDELRARAVRRLIIQ